MFPENPFQYFFVDDHYNQQYHADLQFGNAISLLTLLAIIIACLGLFGLSSYLVVQRTNEIGIRKILGATGSQIMLLVSKEYMLTVLVANVIAWPIVYILAENWLTTFAHRIELELLIFLIPGACILLTAIATVAGQAYKAANTDPIKNLKSE